jgi:hypothetical protein
MWNLVRCTVALLTTSLAFVHGAFAVMEEDKESDFVRPGFYVGVGGTVAFPNGWDSDFDNHLNEEAGDLATENAQAALGAPPPSVIPVSVRIDGADLEDAQFGLNGVAGYRVGALVAFEVEGEWLITKNKSNLDVDQVDEVLPDEFVTLRSSTGSHRTEVDEIWAISANVKVYPPFIGWLERFARFQPYAKVGLGIHHSKFVVDIESSGFTTTNATGTIEVPADFRIRSSDTSLDGMVRVGGGIEIYATRNIVSEINATYVLPFSDVGFLKTDYVSVQWRLAYRF